MIILLLYSYILKMIIYLCLYLQIEYTMYNIMNIV